MLNGRSSVMGAALIMIGVSFLATLLLGWVPLVGGVLGPIAGGFIGGRRAGTVGKAFVAAIMPAILLAGLAFLLGAFAGALGMFAVAIGSFLGIAMSSTTLIVAAMVGAATR